MGVGSMTPPGASMVCVGTLLSARDLLEASIRKGILTKLLTPAAGTCKTDPVGSVFHGDVHNLAQLTKTCTIQKPVKSETA